MSATAAARPAPRPRFGRRAALLAALVAATLLAFAPVVRNGFINFDDDKNLTGNEQVRQGLTPEGLRWAFTTLHSGNWHPLTWVTHLLDFQLFGMHAGGHHAVSALIHAANAALLFSALGAMTGAFWRSALVAALFALHPLRVESVAWAAERKDVLSLMFGLLALNAYVRFVRGRSAAAYAASLGLFACALMSKAMLVTFPALLLLLDLWPLNRWRPGRLVPLLPGRGPLLEKVPYLALAAAASLLAFHAQAAGGAVGYVVQFPPAQRIGNAFLSYAAYLGKTFWPAKLAVFYPYYWEDVPLWQPLAAAALVAATTVAATALLRRHPAFFVGWAWYLGTFLPVIGIVQVGSQSMADRYAYLPQTGVLLALAWGLGDLAAGRPGIRRALAAAAPAVLLALAAATWTQVTRWRSSETLFTHAIRVTRNNYVALANLGSALADAGREAEGNELIKQAFQVNPSFRVSVHDRSGDYFARRGQAREAAEQYRKALEIQPYNRTIQEKLAALGAAAQAPPAAAPGVDPHRGLAAPAVPADDLERGNQLAQAGRRLEAAAVYREALRRQPGNVDLWNNLGCALGEMGEFEESAAAFAEALRLDPAHAAARANLEALRVQRARLGR